MRHRTAKFDLESPPTVPGFAHGTGDNATREDLRRVEVYALGVDGAGKSIAYWQSFKAFWRETAQTPQVGRPRYSTISNTDPLSLQLRRKDQVGKANSTEHDTPNRRLANDAPPTELTAFPFLLGLRLDLRGLSTSLAHFPLVRRHRLIEVLIFLYYKCLHFLDDE